MTENEGPTIEHQDIESHSSLSNVPPIHLVSNQRCKVKEKEVSYEFQMFQFI